VGAAQQPRLAEAEKQLLATANLVPAGIPMVVSQQMRIDALVDSDARLYLHLQQVDDRLARLAVAQAISEQKVSHLADSVQKLVDSWKTGGNDAH
jgi:hypothetical protein